MAYTAHILMGPTASGKTDVAHLIALRREAYLLSADSMLVYRGMDIGTAKPDAAQLAELHYGGLDLADPGSAYSVSRYLEAAAAFAAQAQTTSAPLIVAGGTGLYVRCLCEGLTDSKAPDPALRALWERRVQDEGVSALQAAVSAAHPEAYAAMTQPDQQNARRLIRVLERGPAPADPVQWTQSGAAVLAIRRERDDLRARVRARVERMYAAGLLDEVEALLSAGHLAPDSTARQGIGYAEAITVLRAGAPVADAIDRTSARTWQLARKQMTWLRHQAIVHWIDVAPDETSACTADRVETEWLKLGPTELSGLPTHA